MDNVQVITPNEGYVLITTTAVFLAGPINGALGWRKEFIEKVRPRVDKTVTFLNPQRPNAFTDGNKNLEQNEYDEQVGWEKSYLGIANVIVFNIPKPEEMIEDYGRNTRFELGEWIGHNNMMLDHDIEPAHVPPILIYIDESFPGRRYINKIIKCSHPSAKIFIYETQERLIDNLLKIINTGVSL